MVYPTVFYVIAFIFVFVLGCVIASFLNVLIYRIPAGESFVKGRSHCMSCGHSLGPLDLFPVFSWLFLRGRCRYCHAPISPRYMVVELLGGIVACLIAWVYGFSWPALAIFAFAAGLIAIAFIDLDTMTIPNGLVIYLFIIAAALLWLLPEVTLLQHGIGLLAASLPLLIIALLTGGFGMGDIKLMAAAGLALGWQLIVFALFVGIITGGVYGLWLALVKKAGRKTAFAFGPFLCLGILAALLVGRPVIQWYASLL